MAPSWGVWGPPWLQVGALGTILAPSWGSRGHLGSKLGGQEVILAPSWGIWGPSWLQVGSPPNSNFSKAPSSNFLKNPPNWEPPKLQLFESPQFQLFENPPIGSKSGFPFQKGFFVFGQGRGESRKSPGREGCRHSGVVESINPQSVPCGQGPSNTPLRSLRKLRARWRIINTE